MRWSDTNNRLQQLLSAYRPIHWALSQVPLNENDHYPFLLQPCLSSYHSILYYQIGKTPASNRLHQELLSPYTDAGFCVVNPTIALQFVAPMLLRSMSFPRLAGRNVVWRGSIPSNASSKRAIVICKAISSSSVLLSIVLLLFYKFSSVSFAIVFRLLLTLPSRCSTMPATGPRTSSLSSNASAVDPSKKKFACLFEGCLKSFSRSEHLHRHSLNHKDGANTCTRCSAHFRRRDLLGKFFISEFCASSSDHRADRHMVRHKEKDDEAGGEGLGHLATRKRLWKDADGNIITGRRPFQAPMPKKIVNTDLAIATRDTIASNERNLHSVSGPRRIPGRARVRHVNRKEPPPEPIHTEESIQIAEGDQLEFPEMNSWAMQMDENNFTNNNHNYENIKQEPGE